TFKTRYNEDAPKMMPRIVPRITATGVNSRIRAADGIYGRKVARKALLSLTSNGLVVMKYLDLVSRSRSYTGLEFRGDLLDLRREDYLGSGGVLPRLLERISVSIGTSISTCAVLSVPCFKITSPSPLVASSRP